MRAFEVTAAAAILCAVAISPLPAMLRALGDAAVGPPAGPGRGHSRRTPVVAAAILAVSLALPALAASPLALRRQGRLARRYNLPAVTGRALRAREPAARPARRGGWRSGLVGLRAPCVAHADGSPAWRSRCRALAVSAIVMLLAPWLILLSPRVRPLRDEAVTGRLHALASRAQLRLAGLHEWVFGPHGDHANAALVGVIGPRRLLISDTLIAGCPPEEMDAVVAHELGHHAHGHTWQRVREPGDEPGDRGARCAGECGRAGAMGGRHRRAHRSRIVALDAAGGWRGVAGVAALAARPVAGARSRGRCVRARPHRSAGCPGARAHAPRHAQPVE